MATWSTKSALQELQLGVTGEMTVVERLQYLLDTGQFADVNIRVGQGNNVQVFKAHRLLLATASQPLYRLVTMVNPNPGQHDVTTIRITDMKPADFESILKYIYTDHVDCHNISVAFGLLRASRKWGLAGLGIKSLTFLEEFVDNFEPTTEDSKSNLFDLLVLSEDTLAEVSSKCWQKLLKNGAEIIPCQGYLRLDKPMVQKVLCHRDLKMDDQLKLFEAIRDWGLSYLQRHGLPLSDLGSVVEELIKVVDFEKINDADFLSTVLTSECLGKAEVIAFFMTHGLEIPRKLDFNNNKQLPFWLTLYATSGQEKPLQRGGGCGGDGWRLPSSPASPPSRRPSGTPLATVNETLSKICSLTQNGSVLEFNKVCRFRKGYRCPTKEIYQEHELRFRVDKNIRLLGVGFGFLFSPTDMGINVHCQGPWETRQWTDITQSYCRVSGEKQETADVRLMFLQPVRIEANQSYKVVVKTVRMSHGSSEVELWGGTGGLYCVETEDAEFFFMKAAVDPNKRVEESEGDTRPGIITELLYRIDTGDPDPPPAPRRRRPDPPEEELPLPAQTNPWRRRHRPDTLKIPETPYVRKRSPPGDDAKTPEAPPPSRRRESTDTSSGYSSTASRRPPVEEYKPTSFSTNRWRIRPKEEKEVSITDQERKKSTTEEYRPSSFSTNRWRTRPKEDNKDSTEASTERKKSMVEEYKPTSFSTNRWRAKPKEEEANTYTRKTSTEESKWRTQPQEESKWRTQPQEESKWRTQPQEDKDLSFAGRRRTSSKTDEPLTTLPFVRRRESQETSSEVPFYLRKNEENKPPTGRTRWGGTTTPSSSSSTPAAVDKPAGDALGRSRFLRGSDGLGSSLRSSGSSALFSSSRFGGGRESSLPRARDSTFSRYGSSGSSYLSRYR